MEKTIDYTTHGTCSRAIHVTLEDGIIKKVKFDGGCSGNTQGISSLVVGMDAKEAAKRLRGIRCGQRPTSCPDQLAIAIETALENS